MSTQWLECKDGKTERIFPCRCGETHNGEYAAEIYEHHNCFHHILLVLAKEQAICQDCGETFVLVYPDLEEEALDA